MTAADERTWSRYRAWALTDGRLAPRTVVKSVSYLRYLERHGFPLAKDEISRDAIIELLIAARDSGRAPYTLNLWVSQVNRWARFLELGWRIPHYRHHHEPEVPAPTVDEVRRLWGLTWGCPAVNARNQAIIAVLADKGPRRQELIDLNVQDVVRTRNGWSLVIRHGKGEKERAVPLNDEAAARVRTYSTRYRYASDPVALFTTPRGRVSYAYIGNLVRDAGRRAGIPWLSPHKLRHFVVDDLLDRGVSVVSVVRIMGHEHVETTMAYRAKKLGRQLAEEEVRHADRARFRAEGTAPTPPGPQPDRSPAGTLGEGEIA